MTIGIQLSYAHYHYYPTRAELEITVSPTIFKDVAEHIQFARTKLLHIFNGEANKNVPSVNKWPTNF